jgi:hypothetical protein
MSEKNKPDLKKAVKMWEKNGFGLLFLLLKNKLKNGDIILTIHFLKNV